MLLVESAEELQAIASALGTKVLQDPHGISIIGTDITGRGVYLKVEQVTPVVDVCAVEIVDPKIGELSVARLINGHFDLQSSGRATVVDVKGDRFSIGPALAATIELAPRDPQL